MKSINTLALAALLLAVTGCSNINQLLPSVTKTETAEPVANDKPAATEQTAANANPENGEDLEAAAPKSINPYLANPKPVSEGVEQLFQRALKLHRLQNWPEAELAWQELTLTAPQLSGPYINLGLVYEATERPEDAARAYQFAIDTNPLNVNAYNQLAILKRKSGEFSEAEALYQKALEIWPEHPTSHRNIAILYDLYMGKLALALEHYLQYETLVDEPDRALKGWISDLRRRLDTNS